MNQIEHMKTVPKYWWDPRMSRGVWRNETRPWKKIERKLPKAIENDTSNDCLIRKLFVKPKLERHKLEKIRDPPIKQEISVYDQAVSEIDASWYLLIIAQN
jgi:dephospho-CoA kinase